MSCALTCPMKYVLDDKSQVSMSLPCFSVEFSVV